jgi:5-deoxy-glucuronate isomerase
MGQTLFPPQAGRDVIRIDPAELGWRHLRFSLVSLAAGDEIELDTQGRETILVTVSGAGVAQVGDRAFSLARRRVFEEMAGLLYLPPGMASLLTTAGEWLVALASAPAEGRYPVRLIDPSEMKVEIRGGGPALRQVNHLLAHPLPAERLIVYEVFVPGGAWAGWPPHCHDGLHGSPYLEEIYFFRFDRANGFGFHRNYVGEGEYDEVVTVRDRSCVVVPRGFHVTTSAPGHTMWILNVLAGELVGEERAAPPYFDPTTTWITDDWSRAQVALPVAVQGDRAGSR